jgi:riboflavin kinase / FMN adenylyltransferase
MEIIRHINRHAAFSHPVVSLGNFDGVHRGHQAILARVVDEARKRGGSALVFTFHPHPLAILRPTNPPALIFTLREKLSALASLGIDAVCIQRFTADFSYLTAEEFVRSYFVEAIRAEKIIVGPNVSFGYQRAGRVDTLERLGRQYGIAVECVGPVQVDGREASSTEVRALLSQGDMREVQQLLGRAYAVSGRVEKGFQRGRGLGFPTANLRPRADLLLPNGVYAVTVEVGAEEVAGVANVGMNPTFGGDRKTIEAHLFDFSADLYGRCLRIRFVERLREERKFPSVEELVRQIKEDARRARALLLSQ